MTDLTPATESPHSDLRSLTAEIVAAYLSRNDVAPDVLPGLIRSVHSALTVPTAPEAAVEDAPVPVVNPKKSVFPDYIICLEDGKKLKMLRRHLKTAYNMTPDEYRARWGLPSEYPMVAPGYSAQRSALAREIGLGFRNRSSLPQEEELPPVKKLPEKRRGRPARA
ncbi:MucR family transcriptional regulator [Gluconobacter cerinus]|uniref:MucR family transcriptional regulator n=1 Tax=Gluconobacter cerinus TaxID=38307 RepID=UPI001B8C84BB|nr:MucR family transcriptional regulator [Gluconobacter cerinus]MBS1023135.1 MucR family transcriptional regulator [Gluconobacter cerinus]MBS1025511.1 MucR family transcriptional regulator [Gluconobacter cerinus]